MKACNASSILSLFALILSQTCVQATSEPDLFLPQREELERAKALWDSQASTSYQFQYERIGTPDVPNTVYPWTITVTDGKPTAVDGNSNPISTTVPPTLNQFFQIVQTQLDMQAVQQMDVQYNPQKGYPESVYLVLSPSGIYDVEVSKVVFNTQEPVRTGTMDSKLDQMMEAQMLWRSRNVQNYSYRYRMTTDTPTVPFPWVVTVRNEVSVTANDSNGNAVTQGNYQQPHIVQELFDRIQAAFREGAPYIEVRYNAIYGFPEDLWIVYDDKVADATFEAGLYGFTVDA